MNKLIRKFVKKYETSVFWGTHFLPRNEKLAVYTMCAFCRHISDITFQVTNIAEQKELLNAWYSEIDNIYDKKQPASDLGRSIYKNCMRFHIPKQDLQSFLNAILMDFPTPMKSPTISEFKKYCEGIAGAPCKMYLRILGCNNESQIAELSSSLGLFLQTLIVLRDVKDDALFGHLYIPAEFLQKADIKDDKIENILTNKNLSMAREELSKIVTENYAKIISLLPNVDKRIRKNIKAILNIGKYNFDFMEKRGWEVIYPKPQMSMIKKILLVSKAYMEQ